MRCGDTAMPSDPGRLPQPEIENFETGGGVDFINHMGIDYAKFTANHCDLVTAVAIAYSQLRPPAGDLERRRLQLHEAHHSVQEILLPPSGAM